MRLIPLIFLNLSLFGIFLVKPTWGYFISIDANEEQCFFDRVTSGTKMGLMFEVAEGGFLDIDVKVHLTGGQRYI